jgi:hypothetical protein
MVCFSYKGRIQSNHCAIQTLLDTHVNLSYVSPTKNQPLAVYNIYPKAKAIPDLFFSIFYIDAKVIVGNYLLKKDKPQLLTSAIQKFIYHLSISPFDLDAWYSLARCYSFLSCDYLQVQPIETPKERKKIVDLQKKSFHCFLRTIKLVSNGKDFQGSDEMLSKIWEEFGVLCLRMTSQPVNAEGLKYTNNAGNTIKEMIKSGKLDLHDSSSGAFKPTTKNIDDCIGMAQKAACYLLKRAFELDPNNWTAYFNYAHACDKLDGPPERIISAYMKSISAMPAEWREVDNDNAFDFVYKFLTYLLKSLQKERILVPFY